jgi:hypothetical protein
MGPRSYQGGDLERLTLSDLESRADAFDRAADATPGIDAFCSHLAWAGSFHRAFGFGRELCAFASGESFVALAHATWAPGRAGLEALENMWGFACPLLGPEAGAMLAALGAPGGALAGQRFWLSGLPAAPDLLRARIAALRGWSGREIGRTERCVASLAGGRDGFLSRRSRAFRRNLRAALRRVAARGIRFERIAVDAAHCAPLYERVLAIERRSWKAASGNAADRGPMAEFYRAMWPRLAARGALRLLLAIDAEGRDVGYLHGGSLGRRFRGLQFSFDDGLRELGLGNALQLELVEWLSQQGFEDYDLGSRSDYKQRWAEQVEMTRALLVVPGALA